MHFDLDKKTVSSLLGSKKQFSIPRFQREYSWGKPQLIEFVDDVIKLIKIKDNKLTTTEYFWGTMLFVGSFIDTNIPEMEVVDGQQRLTTMTIFLSAMVKALVKKSYVELSDKVWEYIMFVDDDLNKKAILLNETPNPFFQRLVQLREEQNGEPPKSVEEERIKAANDFFASVFEEKVLRKKFENFGLEISGFTYLDLIKAIRDQILSSIIICMSTSEKKEASMIFEILNAKGKSLDDIDLIKNKIFEVISTEYPTDEAKLRWSQTKKNLASRGDFIDFSMFFYHFWNSKYKRVTYNKLYADFLKTVKKNETDYLLFLNDLEAASKEYVKILVPQNTDYANKQELLYIIEIYNNLNNIFNIKQSLIALMALNSAFFEKKIMSSKIYKKVLQSMERSHFIFNALLSQRTSRLDKIYSNFAINLRKCKNKDESHKFAENLMESFNKEMPGYAVFEEKFIELSFSKRFNEMNPKTKYAVQSIAKYLGGLNMVPNGSSIEHIMDEDKDSLSSLNIGNLILLESNINSIIPDNSDFALKKNYYKESSYKCVVNFLNDHKDRDTWTEENIQCRAKEMAKLYYTQILQIEKNEEDINRTLSL